MWHKGDSHFACPLNYYAPRPGWPLTSEDWLLSTLLTWMAFFHSINAMTPYHYAIFAIGKSLHSYISKQKTKHNITLLKRCHTESMSSILHFWVGWRCFSIMFCHYPISSVIIIHYYPLLLSISNVQIWSLMHYPLCDALLHQLSYMTGNILSYEEITCVGILQLLLEPFW